MLLTCRSMVCTVCAVHLEHNDLRRCTDWRWLALTVSSLCSERSVLSALFVGLLCEISLHCPEWSRFTARATKLRAAICMPDFLGLRQ